MKVIELLNKIANGEEVPKKIYFKYSTYQFDEIDKVYRNINGNQQLEQDYMISNKLNDEVEIIEEEKKIPEKLKSLNNVGNVPNLVEFADKQQLNNHLIKDKLNEVIDYLDYLKSKGEE